MKNKTNLDKIELNKNFFLNFYLKSLCSEIIIE